MEKNKFCVVKGENLVKRLPAIYTFVLHIILFPPKPKLDTTLQKPLN